MDIKMHGKNISQVFWNEGKESLDAERDGLSLFLSATFHGDHDEFWIVEMRDGVEIARHNPRYVDQIIWMEE